MIHIFFSIVIGFFFCLKVNSDVSYMVIYL